MIISRLFKVVSISIALLFTQACSHPIEIVGQGDVTSASGNRNCYLEDFQAASTKCTKNYAIGAYQETYYAQPRVGWQFDKWVNYCGNATPPNYDCTFNVSADVVARFWGQTVSPLKAVFKTCTPGAPGCGWKAGEMETASQTTWGNSTTAAGAMLISTFNAFYPGDLVIGGTYTLRFTDSSTVFSYLPALGSPGALTSTVIDPISTSAGDFGGELVALKLNVDHSSLFGNSRALSGLTICSLATLPAMNGQTVSQFLTIANHILGGGSASISAGQASALARFINVAFVDGNPSAFAQASLIAGGCPTN